MPASRTISVIFFSLPCGSGLQPGQPFGLMKMTAREPRSTTDFVQGPSVFAPPGRGCSSIRGPVASNQSPRHKGPSLNNKPLIVERGSLGFAAPLDGSARDDG